MLPDLTQLDAWLAQAEARVDGLRPRCEKHIVWAGQAGEKTPVSIVYVHGFSATGAEVRPLPDLVAQALGANLYFARLTGHGQDGAAMGRARLADWDTDVAEALDIGHRLGEAVIVMGCSTGCTLLTHAVARRQDIDAVVHLSPNFGLRSPIARTLLRMPGVRRWGHLVAGRERSFVPISDDHAALWTVKYDTRAVYTMGDAVREALRSRIEDIRAPAYFAFSDEDQVVHPAHTRTVMARWGGPVTVDILTPGPGDDPMGHVMAGDVFSPAQTRPLADRIIAWAKDL